MSRGIESKLKAGAQGGGFFCALGAALGFMAQSPQPHPLFWYRVFGSVCAATALSCVFLPWRNRFVRWSAVGCLSALGGLLVAIAVTTAKENQPPAIIAELLAYLCYRGVKILLQPDIRDYFNMSR